MRRTILHPLTLQPLHPVGYRKDGRPIWPILGGSEPPNQPPATPPAPPAAPANQPPATPPNPPDRGFPENTPLAEMTTEQQLAYHRFHSRKWQERAEARSDYDAIKAKADELDQLKASQATDQEKAVTAAREEGRTQALKEANEKAVTAILRGALAAKGKTGDELDLLVAGANPSAFISDGNVDADKVTAYAASIAGSGAGTPPPDLGQGRREQQTGSGVAAGAERYKQRHRSKTPASA